MIKPKVLFLCTGNSRRTQMAEGFLRAMARDHFEAMSAGSEETLLDPDAVAVMREVGVDISGQHPKAVNRFLGRAEGELSRDAVRSGEGAHLPGFPRRNLATAMGP
jgi:arsenate reductase